MMQYLTPLQQQIAELRAQQNSWAEMQQRQETTSLQTEIEQFAAGNEHFDAVRATMAGLLQSGLAQDLNEAYTKAVRMEGLESHQAHPAAVVRQARAAAVSPKSATPAATKATSGKSSRF
jgi:hypothetical protein